MKRKWMRTICVFLVGLLSISNIPAMAGWGDFTDVSGHWAEASLESAYMNGLIKGYPNSCIKPDQNISKAESLAMLTRVLRAEGVDGESNAEVSSGVWYYGVVGQAVAMSIIKKSELSSLEDAVSREEVFLLIGRAFQLIAAEQDVAVLTQYTDSGQISYSARDAVAALAQRGYVIGYNGELKPRDSITRAEMVTVLERIVGNYMLPEEVTSEVTGGVSIPAGTKTGVNLSDLTLHTDVLVNGEGSGLTLNDVHSNGRILIRSANLAELSMTGGNIRQIVLAAVNGDIVFMPNDKGKVDTFTVGDGTGIVHLSEKIEHIEITGSHRTVLLGMSNLKSMKICGDGNHVFISEGVNIEELKLFTEGEHNTIEMNGNVNRLTVLGDNNKVTGTGYIKQAHVRGLDCKIKTKTGEYREDFDYGLTGVKLILEPSTERVSAGGSLTVNARFVGVRGNAVVSAKWYKNGEAVPGYGNDSFYLTYDKTSVYNPPITFAEDMETSLTVGMELTYLRGNVQQKIYEEIRVEIENYPYEHYHPAPPVPPGPTAQDKLIALTFDDGPGKYTEWLLNELAARGVKATFFVVGNRVNQYPDVIRRMVNEGHEIASHTYSHVDLSKSGGTAIRNQLDRTAGALQNIAGVNPTCLRPPYGSYNKTVQSICAEKGLPVIYWSVDTEDWRSRNVSTILKRMFNNGSWSVKDGDIILMHDIYSTSVTAAVSSIDRLLADGYNFVTVSELLELRSGGGQPGRVYKNARP